MIELVQVLTDWLTTDRVTEMAERVAGRSRLAVWQRVQHRLHSLAPDEARGYLRARAVTVVREETDRLIQQEGFKVARRSDQIGQTALSMLIEAIVGQLQRQAPDANTRRAA